MSSDRAPPSRNTTIVCGAMAVVMGLLLLLTGLGVLPPPRRASPGALWVGTAAGLGFMFAGISIVVGALHGVSSTGELPKDAGWWSRLFYYVFGLVACVCLAAVGSWVAFGPGMRHFGGTGMFLLSAEANHVVGRIIFGIGAVLIWLCVIALGVSGARKLFPRNSD